MHPAFFPRTAAMLRRSHRAARLVLLLCLALAWGGRGSSVIRVTSLTFEEELRAATSGDALMLVFHAPWCGHCRQLAPVLDQFAAQAKENRIPVRVGKVDATAERALATRFHIRAYPTIFFLRDGKVYTYGGRRSAEAFAKFVQGGMNEATPLSMLSSPLGPIGRMRGLVTGAGQRFMGASDSLEKEYGLPKGVAMVAVAVMVGLVCLFALIGFVWMTLQLEKEKED